jgi:hypothetical protein
MGAIMPGTIPADYPARQKGLPPRDIGGEIAPADADEAVDRDDRQDARRNQAARQPLLLCGKDATLRRAAI